MKKGMRTRDTPVTQEAPIEKTIFRNEAIFGFCCYIVVPVIHDLESLKDGEEKFKDSEVLVTLPAAGSTMVQGPHHHLEQRFCQMEGLKVATTN